MKRKLRLRDHYVVPPGEDVGEVLPESAPVTDPSGGLNAYYAEIEKDVCGNCKHFRRVTDDRGQCIERPLKLLRFDHWTCPTHKRK